MSEEDVSQLSLIISEMFCNTTIHILNRTQEPFYTSQSAAALNALESFNDSA
jgi:hypothetical protein